MLLYKQQDEHILWGIWKIEESEEELLSQLTMSDDLKENILALKLKTRRIERLALRVLLKNLLQEEKRIYYLPSGAPYINEPNCYITLSHTKGYAAAAFSNQPKIGIDIEAISQKVHRVRTKFISKKEYIDPENELIHLLIHWTAKEATYKAINIEGIDFANDIQITPFHPEKEGKLEVKEYATTNSQSFNVKYIIQNDFVLSYSIESTKYSK